MRALTIGVGEKVVRINVERIARVGTTTSFGEQQTWIEMSEPQDMIYVGDALGKAVLEWWDAQAEILIADVAREPMVSKEVWDRAVAENVGVTNPDKLAGAGDMMNFPRFVSAIDYLAEHTFFRAIEWSDEAEAKAVFIIFRCDCFGRTQYEGSVFHPLDDGSWKRADRAMPSLIEVCTWLGRCGLAPELGWQIIPVAEGTRP